jgi:hypothetical protein
MANPEKHKRNLIHEFLGGDETEDAAHERSVHLIGRAAKSVPRRFRLQVVNGQVKRPDVALAREPGPPPKVEEKHSQASSPEHLRRVQRLAKLRAPYPKSGRPSPGIRG